MNEYVELLWNMLVHAGYKGERKSRQYSVELSHDVDAPLHSYCYSIKKMIRAVMGDIVKRKNIRAGMQKAINYGRYRCGLPVSDPYDTFDFIMNVSEDNNLESRFFFIPDSTNRDYDAYYKLKNSRIKSLIKRIDERGHRVSIHTSYETYKDSKQTAKEYSLLVGVLHDLGLQSAVVGGRQHYLRFAVPYACKIGMMQVCNMTQQWGMLIKWAFVVERVMHFQYSTYIQESS